VPDADVSVTYGDDALDAFDSTDDAGRVVFPDQPVGVAATITAEDLDGRTGSVSSAGFPTGTTQLTVTIR